MINFFNFIFYSSLIFAFWYLIGIGPAYILLWRQRTYAFLLAPLVGMSLLTLVNLYEMTVLLIPITPKINIVILSLISITICFVTMPNRIRASWNQFCKRKLFYFWAIPIIMGIAFAWMFHNSGSHLIVGASDQLQYSQNARFMLEDMNTGSELDTPIPRQDYFLAEMCTHELSYTKATRHGGEVLLATTSAITGLTCEEAFSITILCALITLGLILGLIAKLFLRLSLTESLLIQLVFLSSFYLFLLHIQGSMGLLIGLAPGLLSIALLSRVASFTWRWFLLTIIILSAYFSIYSEPALVMIIIPSMFLVLKELFLSIHRGLSLILRVLLIYLASFICAPYGLYSVFNNMIGNLFAIFHFTPVTIKSSVTISEIISQWLQSSVILGATSYYDVSSFNSLVAIFFANTPWIVCISFFALSGLAIFGFFKNKHLLAHLYGIILILWIIASILLAYKHDTLRFARSLHYSMPFILIGLVILISNKQWHDSKRNSLSKVVFVSISKVVLIGFIIMNVYTASRTIRYITANDVSTDKILMRFNERSAPWRSLHDELSVSAAKHSPVLISGFQNTIVPTAISTVLRAQPHVLGDSIASFWPIYELRPSYLHYSDYHTRLSENDFLKHAHKEGKDWSNKLPKLIERSEQAVVPVGYGYPSEWISSKDVFAPRITRITNICDIVYKNEYAITLDNKMSSPLKKDEKGPFRLLLSSGRLFAHSFQTNAQLLILKYEGRVGDVRLEIGNKFFEGVSEGQNGHVKIQAAVNLTDANALNLVVKRVVKLRDMYWTPISDSNENLN